MDYMTEEERLKAEIKHHFAEAERKTKQLAQQRILGVTANVIDLLSMLEQQGVLQSDRKVDIIKAVQEATGLDLKESKTLVVTAVG